MVGSPAVEATAERAVTQAVTTTGETLDLAGKVGKAALAAMQEMLVTPLAAATSP